MNVMNMKMLAVLTAMSCLIGMNTSVEAKDKTPAAVTPSVVAAQGIQHVKQAKQSKQTTVGSSVKKPADDSLPVYNPKKDAAPSEGIPIVETNFKFTEPLLVRPKTDTIVVHHVGIPDGDTSAAAIHRAHLHNGWAGIGYQYVIRKDGTIERGRPLATVGAHAYGQNYHTVGICVTGNFEKETPTKAQVASLENLLTSLCTIYKIQPGATTIVGHRDENDTDCPGRNLYKMLPEIRDDVHVKLFEEKLKGTHLLKLKKYEQQDQSQSQRN
jgi:hypothetical protein